MRFSTLSLLAISCNLYQISAKEATAATCSVPPYVGPKLLIHGKLIVNIADATDDATTGDDDISVTLSDVHGCCGVDAQDPTKFTRPLIGQMPQMSSSQTLAVLRDAEAAWNGGSGVWPQMSLRKRLEAIENLLRNLETNHREQMVQVLMWEIGKNRKDAESEFDRTIAFGREVMDVVRGVDSDSSSVAGNEFGGSWQHIGSTMAFVRRAAVGIVLCLGPMNYPLNETYATLIPALLMGNVVLMKIPTVGGLVHLLTMEAFQKALPPGAMNFVSGRGRDTMPTLMGTGKIDALAFIGGSSAADDLIRQHPHPHRLKVFLQLEAKNMGIFLSDMFQSASEEELNQALDQALLGALSFNGQRCTALKLFFIPKGYGEFFSQKMAQRIEAMKVGLPWETVEKDISSKAIYSHVTPLPNKNRLDLMRRLINDAVSKGAKIVNKKGGEIIGGPESTLMVPAVLYPVTPDMDLYLEEQFGPIVPITEYDSLDTVIDYGQNGLYGQQVSIFVSEKETKSAASLLDRFSTVFGKININSQCGRSPDTLPFSGRRSSAMGVMSVKDALREFSIPTVVSYKDSDVNTGIVQEIESESLFLSPL
ncbi:NADP-dependent glyceraldehyde-3-phosphate dehydrogenase [Nitzschia inconspicua]|uniref:Succinate-semialdehyde dehydrogenase, mitochondrial n=1 Tax=Nitzschia inconspicua TaxID=303405 RepID=A0A9K3PLX8_9STRA|nr:NADP-dependent glyceraldehyde-3-phosphate dehydrogenase [Nitzschia inconspicua]